MAKNIVLLSDGTGNSAAKPFKTNVWRLYQAIDINPPKTDNEPHQIVYYDDGVGTGDFKPLAYLGLALGFGLARNVKDLYTFICRNYSEGDNIFLFGFSRGAFTVRVLAGMILRCGLVHAANEADLREQVDIVYDAYKVDGVRRATKTGRAKLFGALAGGYERAKDLKFVPLGDKINQRFPRIAFLGVWDTVDAYGVPLDEIKIGIDRYIWPMTLADRDLSPLVDRACHALSLDDERPTFRPVLWNEVKTVDGKTEPISEEQLTQVWFSGVHANVGGGYPDDGLAHVTLQWMMDEAQKQGLWFYPHSRLEVDSRANGHGKQYDSRTGLSGYYRYGPRCVDELCDDSEHGVKVKVPKVHNSAVDRVKSWEVAYAPVSFPTNYEVMKRTQNPLGLTKVPRPPNDDILARSEDMRAAWNAVIRRRYAYLATVWLTVFLAMLPPLDRFFGWGSAVVTAFADLLRLIPGVAPAMAYVDRGIAKGIGYIPAYIGGWTRYWTDWYQQHPLFFLVAAVLLAWLFVRKNALLQDEIFARADYAWRRVRPSAPDVEPAGALTGPVVQLLQSKDVMPSMYRFLITRIIPFVLAIPVLIAGLLIAILYIPKRVRLERLRRKYEVKPTPRKTGEIAPEPIRRKPCPAQAYKEMVRPAPVGFAAE